MGAKLTPLRSPSRTDSTDGGPVGRDLFSMPLVAIETACLLTSSLFCGIAGLGAQARNSRMFHGAMAVTFVSPHSLHARPLVVPRGLELRVRNETRATTAKVIADGIPVADLGEGKEAAVRLGERRALLALLPEMTFFHRYRDTFAS